MFEKGPKIILEEKPETEIEVIKRNRAMEEIEKSGFEQKSFSSSFSGPKSEPNEFEFATAAEKATTDKVSKVIEQIESEGLCHPDWFRDPEERNAKYLRYLSQLRRK